MWDFISQILQAALPSVVSAGTQVGATYLANEMAPKPKPAAPQGGQPGGFMGLPSGPVGIQGAGAGMRSMGLQSGAMSGGQPLADNSHTYQGQSYQQAQGQGIQTPKPKSPFEGV